MYLSAMPMMSNGDGFVRSMMIRGRPTPIVLPPPILRRPIVVQDGGGFPTPLIPVQPITTGPVYGPLTPPTSPASPVPAGFPTNQIFVNSDGSFWQWSGSAWMNVGTPYGTGASPTPPAPAPSPTGASTAPPTGTTAPPPVNVTVAAGSGYQEILAWLQEDTLASSIGFSGIPNWIVAAAGGLLAYKLSASGGRR